MSNPAVVLIDTDVYSALYTDPERATRRGLPVAQWRNALEGKRVVISFQTRAEVLTGLRASNWGEKRLTEAVAKLDSAQTIPCDRDVIDAFASLGAECRRTGHPLHDRVHTGDRWIAASAIAKGIALLARDGIYVGAPWLDLLDGPDV